MSSASDPGAGPRRDLGPPPARPGTFAPGPARLVDPFPYEHPSPLAHTAAAPVPPPPAADSQQRLARRSRRLVVLGVAGAVLLLIGIALIRLLAIRPFNPKDESANVDYAVAVTHGRLPVAGRPIHPQFNEQLQVAQHTSNHPPLYHLLAGPFLRWGLDSGHSDGGVLAARCVSLVFGMLAVVLMGGLVCSLAGPRVTGRRAQAAVTAAALLAGLSTFVLASAQVQNDTLATALLIGALIPAVRIVRHGVTPARVATMAALATATCLTRMTSVPACLVATATVALAGWLWPRRGAARPLLRRMGRAAAPAGAVLVTIAAGAGWFVGLNLSRYGDWTGGAAVEEVAKVRNEPGSDSELSYLLETKSWLVQLWQVTGGTGTAQKGVHQPPRVEVLALVLGGLLVLGLVAFAARLIVRRVRLDAPQVLCAVALALLVGLAMGEIAVHAANHGGVHGRYLFPAVAALVIGACTLLWLPWRLGVLAVAATLGIECYGALYIHSFAIRARSYGSNRWIDGMIGSLDSLGVPHPQIALGVMLGVSALGLLLVLVSLWLLHPRRPARVGWEAMAPQPG